MKQKIETLHYDPGTVAYNKGLDSRLMARPITWFSGAPDESDTSWSCVEMIIELKRRWNHPYYFTFRLSDGLVIIDTRPVSRMIQIVTISD